MERNKRLKKSKWKKRWKRLIICLIILFTIVGINIVNKEIKRTGFLENSNLLRLDIEERSFDFLGKRYYLDLNILKENLSNIRSIL